MMLDRLVTCQRLILMGRMSTTVIHEVNNQLTGVSGYAQLLLGRDHAETIQKELDKIISSAGRCQKLLKDLRRMGRFGETRKELNNINLIIKSCVDQFRHQFEKKSFKVTENYSEEIPAVEVDTAALEQVFLNIIQNSFEALLERGGCLNVATLLENGRLVAIFEDNGPGLGEEAAACLFTPFFTTKAHLQCSGLGLAAAKMIVEAQLGTIEVNNSPGGGARVRVSLPCQSSGE